MLPGLSFLAILRHLGVGGITWARPALSKRLVVPQATLLAFSYNVLVGIELVAGNPLPAAEQEDYLALWRYIGWLLGVDGQLDPCRNAPRAKAMLESVIMHLLEVRILELIRI